MKQCNIQYQRSEQPIADFEVFCIAEASARGYLGGDDDVLRRAIGVGATIAITGYSHLLDERVRIYIALYTGMVVYLDDVVLSHIDAIRAFVPRFVARQPQQLKTLDDFAALLLETPQLFNSVACNIILSSTLDFVSSLLIQTDVLGVSVSHRAPREVAITDVSLPRYRRLPRSILCSSGAFQESEMLSPPSSFLRACLSTLGFMHYRTSHTVCARSSKNFSICIYAEFDTHLTSIQSDIMSFYKEDLAEEVEDGLIWLAARNHNISAHESLCIIANETIDTHERALLSLEPFQDAYEAFCRFMRGYCDLHVESKRYKLQELGL